MIIILLIGSISISMADERESTFENTGNFSGYSYNPAWNGNISFIDNSTIEVEYDYQKTSLLGKIEINFMNQLVAIPFDLKYDEQSSLYYGFSELKCFDDLKNVNIVVETTDFQIKRIDLIIDNKIAYTFGDEVSFKNMILDINIMKTNIAKEIELEPEMNLITTLSDSSIIGEKSSDGLYVHTTLDDLSLNEEGWMGTRVFTTSSHTLSHITSVEIDGTKSLSEYNIETIMPVGSCSNPLTLEEEIFYFALGYYLGIDIPVLGYNGAASSSQWQHTYNMWDDWNDHIYTSINNPNGIVSDAKMKRVNSSGGLSGTISVDVTEYITATGYFYHDLSYSYSK